MKKRCNFGCQKAVTFFALLVDLAWWFMMGLMPTHMMQKRTCSLLLFFVPFLRIEYKFDCCFLSTLCLKISIFGVDFDQQWWMLEFRMQGFEGNNVWWITTVLLWCWLLQCCVVSFYVNKIEELQIMIQEKTQNLERLKAQRNELNNRVKVIREELTCLHEPGSYVGEVVKPMGKLKILVKVNHDGKYVVDLEKDIDVNKCTPNTRVALRSDSYTLHKILPTKVDPLVSLMKVRINWSPREFASMCLSSLLSVVIYSYHFVFHIDSQHVIVNSITWHE